MAEEEKKLGRPKKEKPKLTNAPIQFVADEELGITDMQAGFVCELRLFLLGSA